MKAKGYAVQFDKLAKVTSVETAEERVLVNYLLDAKVLAKKRHVSTKPGLYSVLRELNDKWRAMAKRDSRIKESFFQNHLFKADAALGKGSLKRRGPVRHYC